MLKLVEHYQTFLRYLEKVTLAVAMCLAAGLLVVNAAGIITEQVTGNSLIWVEEISNLLFTWIIFLGAGAIALRGGHIGVDLLHGLFGPRLMAALRVLFAALALIVVWVMVYYGYKMALFVGKSQTSLYLNISLFYYYLSVPVGGLIFGLNAVGAALPGAPAAEEHDSALEEVHP